MLFYNLIPKGAHAPFGNPLEGLPSQSALCAASSPIGRAKSRLPGDAFMANPWSRLHGGEASLDPPPGLRCRVGRFAAERHWRSLTPSHALAL